MFTPLTEQVDNVRRWNEERSWGLNPSDLDAFDVTPQTHPDPLVVDLVGVYLDGEHRGEAASGLDGVRRTCHELWSIAAENQLHAWSWDWLHDAYDNQPKPVRLLSGVTHRPGVRRVTVNLGAHWRPGRHIRPEAVRGPDSAHAEILAAAAQFPRWAKAMDGISVPYVWLPGYQVTIPEYAADTRLPGLAWVQYRQTLSMTVTWVDHSHSGWAAPTCTR